MTPEQKEAITSLRADGLGYKAIANKLSISVNSVKSFCRRNRIEKMSNTRIPAFDFCPICASKLIHTKGKKKKKFCSDTCRMAWWNSHKGLIQRESFFEYSCSFCRKKFQVYGKQARKYCSHSCYIKKRFGGNNE